jgi:hypothetical protein
MLYPFPVDSGAPQTLRIEKSESWPSDSRDTHPEVKADTYIKLKIVRKRIEGDEG